MKTATRYKLLPVMAFAFASMALTAEDSVERWAAALGGRQKLAGIKALYREASLEYAGYEGTIKVWHTADGKYRKEEKVAGISTIETFDGATGMVQQGTAEPHRMSSMEIREAMSRRFANANALFYVFFPERRRGSLDVEPDGTIVLKPEGGIDWRVTLDRNRGLPKTMMHQEGDRTVTVSFQSYEAVEGIMFEKEIHRSVGGSGPGAVIRFTKTVVNPPIDDVLFSLSSKDLKEQSDKVN